MSLALCGDMTVTVSVNGTPVTKVFEKLFKFLYLQT